MLMVSQDAIYLSHIDIIILGVECGPIFGIPWVSSLGVGRSSWTSGGVFPEELWITKFCKALGSEYSQFIMIFLSCSFRHARQKKAN